jgi:hypothetical protein
LKNYLQYQLEIPEWIRNYDPAWRPGKYFNDVMYQKILTCKIAEAGLSRFISSATQPLYNFLEQHKDLGASALAQPYHTGKQVDEYFKKQDDLRARLDAVSEQPLEEVEPQEIPSSNIRLPSNSEQELEDKFRAYLKSKPARQKDGNLSHESQRMYFSGIFSKGSKCSIRSFVQSIYPEGVQMIDFQYKLNCTFKMFDESMLGYISAQRGTTANLLCNSALAFCEYLKQIANHTEIAFDDLLNENQRMKYLAALARISELLSKKNSGLNKRIFTERRSKSEVTDFLEPEKNSLIMKAYPTYFLSAPFKEKITGLEKLAEETRKNGVLKTDRVVFDDLTRWLMLQLVMFNGGRAQTADSFKNKHFLAKSVALLSADDKLDYTKIQYQFKGVLDEGDLQKYTIGALDTSEKGKTGAIRLILPKVLARAMEQYHFLKSILNNEDAYTPDAPFFINLDGKQIKTANIHKTLVARQMAQYLGLSVFTITQNRHGMASRQRAAGAVGDTGLNNEIATIEANYNDHREAQGIVNKNKANALIFAKAAAEPQKYDAATETFYSKKAAKDHEVAQKLIKEQVNIQAFQSQVGRVEERGPRCKLKSSERKILCLAAYSMIDLEYSAWIFNSPSWPKSIIDWQPYFERFVYGPAGEDALNMVFDICAENKLTKEVDNMKSLLKLVKQSLISWNRTQVDNQRHCFLRFQYIEERLQTALAAKKKSSTELDTVVQPASTLQQE